MDLRMRNAIQPVNRSACVLPEEPPEVIREHRRLVDGNERPAVIDPDEFGVLEVLRQAPCVLRRHQLVLAGPPLSANMPETPAPRGISVGRGGEDR